MEKSIIKWKQKENDLRKRKLSLKDLHHRLPVLHLHGESTAIQTGTATFTFSVFSSTVAYELASVLFLTGSGLGK